MSIEVVVSGRRERLDPGATVASVMRDQPPTGVAVARNGEVVPRTEWAATALADGDVLEIVRPTQGG